MSADAASLKPPPSRERRVNSAKARLTPSGPQKEQYDAERATKEARERVKSAKAIREKHEGSGRMFPRPKSRSGKERFTSSYSTDFYGKPFIPPAELRPTSPTRRNNPHPAKQFMVWKLPSREIGIPSHDEGLELPPEYVAADPNFDAIDELGRSIDHLKIPPPQPSSMEYGAYLREQRAAQRKAAEEYASEAFQQKEKSVSRDVLQRTLKTDTDSLEDWLTTATPKEQSMVLKMLKSAEEAQVKETIHDVMQPAAAKAVESWLKEAGTAERDVAVRLFSSLGSRPDPPRRPRSRSVGERPLSRPSSQQPLPPPIPKSSAHTGPSGERLRSRRLSAPPSGPSPQKPWPAGLWHHLPVRDPPPQVYHRGALFGTARGGASHYTVHPEWPDYHGSSFNSDVVH